MNKKLAELTVRKSADYYNKDVTLKDIALELLQKYEESETSLIWEYSGDIDKSEKYLDAEVAKYRELIDKYAEQEPKTGHWIEHEEQLNALGIAVKGGVKCSECGYTTHNILHMEIGCPYKYCPNCGAKMIEPTCDTCEYNTAAFMPCNACDDKSEYKPQESEISNE